MRNPLAHPIKAVALSLVTTVALFSSTTSAQAGAAEAKALAAAVSGTTLVNATSEQLFDAFVAVIQTPKFTSPKKQGVVAGEALKAAGANATDAGAFFAAAIEADPDLFSTLGGAAGLENFIALAAKAAGSGKGIDVTQIVDLSDGLIDAEGSATNAALLAKNKPGAGAILGGHAVGLPTDNSRITFANSSIANSKLKSAVQDIARYIGGTANDSAAFAVAVALANPKSELKIGTGVVAGDPTNAGEIVESLFANATLKGVFNKGVAPFAKSVGAVADIEEVQRVAAVIGAEVRSGAIKLAKAAGIVKTLTKAIASKPLTDKNTTPIAVNRRENQLDEAAETAASMVAALIGSAELTGAKKPDAVIVKIIKSAIAGAKFKGITVSQLAGLSADIAASVALTIDTSTLSDTVKLAIETALLNPKTAKSIGGKNGETPVANALTDAYAGNSVGRFENGNLLAGEVNDPETDVHAFF